MLSNVFGCTGPVLTFHHIGYATREIEPVVELYMARFGYKRATAILHDPRQTALVQFLQLAEERGYLEFVAPDGPKSKLANVARRGGSLNHLCYTSGPLEASIARLEETGLKLIVDPYPGVAFGGRRICWLMGEEPVPIELVERRDEDDLCVPGPG